MNQILLVLTIFLLQRTIVKPYELDLDIDPTQISPWEEIFQYKNKEILLNNTPQTWFQAELSCKYHFGGALVMPKTEEFSKHLAQIMSESQMKLDNLWIGLKKEYWIDGSPLNKNSGIIKFFLKRDPDNEIKYLRECHTFVRINHDQPGFDDLNCRALRGAICMR